MPTRKAWFLSLASFFLAALASGDEAIANWSAPAAWSPPRSSHAAATMGDISNPLPFIAVTPCRQYDSRNATPLPQNTAREVVITGAPCGLPVSAAAVSLNVTVFDILGQTGNAVLQVGTTSSPTTAWINYPIGQGQIGNAGALPLSGAGSIFFRVQQGAGSIDFTIDVNGYYSSTTFTNRLASGEFFGISGTRSGDAVIYGENNSSAFGSSGIWGISFTPTGTTYGARGTTGSISGDAAGVYGIDGSGQTPGGNNLASAGIRGESRDYYGVLGLSRGIGVTGAVYSTAGAALAYGYLGTSFGPSGAFGQGATTTDSAGVRGFDGTGASAATGRASAGVRGESATNVGVYGFSRYAAVVGDLVNTSGSAVAFGVLGAAVGTAMDSTSGMWAVFAGGNLGASGAKHFVEPHPSDPTKVIVYSSLEGREVGTYFRGTARTVKGEAVIEVPEDFRIVTEEEGLTVQLTPMGDLATLAVLQKGLDRIVVRSSKDVTFDYLVQGVRRAFKDFEPVASGMEFAPRSPEDTMPLYLTDEAKRRLIANGTYNPDGTVNMQTAERVGWTQVWREREERNKAAAATLGKSR